MFDAAHVGRPGLSTFSSANRRSWPPWRWPTRLPASPGSLWSQAKVTPRNPRPPPWGARHRDQPDTGSTLTATVLSRCQNLQGNEQIVRSIDPRRETLRGVQWPPKIAEVFG